MSVFRQYVEEITGTEVSRGNPVLIRSKVSDENIDCFRGVRLRNQSEPQGENLTGLRSGGNLAGLWIEPFLQKRFPDPVGQFGIAPAIGLLPEHPCKPQEQSAIVIGISGRHQDSWRYG